VGFDGVPSDWQDNYGQWLHVQSTCTATDATTSGITIGGWYRVAGAANTSSTLFTTDSIPTSWNYDPPKPPTKAALLKEKIRNQLTVIIRNAAGDRARLEYGMRSAADFRQVDAREARALVMLKGMLDADSWQRYLKNGFIVTRGPSGLVYQIPRGHQHVVVRREAKPVAELCIRVQDTRVPPTDRVAMLKLMAELDEERLWAEAGIHRCHDFGYYANPTVQQLQQLTA